jgi:hypothetical protein
MRAKTKEGKGGVTQTEFKMLQCAFPTVPHIVCSNFPSVPCLFVIGQFHLRTQDPAPLLWPLENLKKKKSPELSVAWLIHDTHDTTYPNLQLRLLDSPSRSRTHGIQDGYFDYECGERAS